MYSFFFFYSAAITSSACSLHAAFVPAIHCHKIYGQATPSGHTSEILPAADIWHLGLNQLPQFILQQCYSLSRKQEWNDSHSWKHKPADTDTVTVAQDKERGRKMLVWDSSLVILWWAVIGPRLKWIYRMFRKSDDFVWTHIIRWFSAYLQHTDPVLCPFISKWFRLLLQLVLSVSFTSYSHIDI